MKIGTITSGMSGTITSGMGGTISPEWVARYHRNRWHNYLRNMQIESTEIILPFSNEILKKFEEDSYLIKASKVFRVFFHSITNDIEFERSKISKIYYSTQIISNDSCCGQISALDFSNNSKHVFKSLNYNSCLYKKIGIDVNGNIKNCPSLTKISGTVDNLHKMVLTSDIYETAVIKKDNIEVCKDCEFRHICTDCRAFTDSKSRPNARPSKCQYNPYISKWSHEEGYRTLAECGVISNEHEFSIDHEKIALINKELWADE